MTPRDPERNLDSLLADLGPEIRPGRFVFVDGDDPRASGLDISRIMASVEEPEGRSLLLLQEDADRAGLEYSFVAAWIVLGVESALDAVGLTAHVSTRLADAGIPCNVIAGLRHDHLLVPVGEAERALRTLR